MPRSETWAFVISGGGGNRTRVLRYRTRASPGASCCAFLGPTGPTGQPVTGSAAVVFPSCPAAGSDGEPPVDARFRAGGTPGLTAQATWAARASVLLSALVSIPADG